MTYYYVSQEVYIEPYQPSLDWMRDIVLATPLLEGPKDQSTLCRQTAFTTDTGVIVKWLAVSGAAFYVVQWCNNSSFTGPTLKATKTADIYYNLQFGTDIRIGEDVFWRVMAFNSSTGAVSSKSEVWQFTYDCSKMGGNLPDNQNQQPDGGGGSGEQGSLCDEFNVSVKIKGPEGIMCCDKNMWHVLITYDCEASDGTPVVMSGVTWEIKQSGTAVHTVLLANNNLVVIYSNPGVGDDNSEKFTIKAKVLFTVGLTTFECADEFRVTMDCDTGRPTVKPWLQTSYSGYGVRQYTNPDYVGSSLGYMDTYFSTVFPHLGGSTSAIATGPVIQVGLTTGLPNEPTCACDYKIDTGLEESVVHEARVHIPLGCGLEVVDGSIAVNNDILVGPGLKTYGECGLQIDYGDEYLGCGLERNGDYLRVKNTDLAGPGLLPYGECGLQVYEGCGLKIVNDILQVDVRDLVGEGLEVDLGPGLDECRININYGCGLTIESVGGPLEVDNLVLAGFGLSPQGDCGLQVLAGCGLKIGLVGEVMVDNVDLAGPGLTPFNDINLCGLQINYGCGLTIVADVLKVKNTDLAGPGLVVWGECGLQVYRQSGYYGYYEIGCGLVVGALGANVLSVAPLDIAGKGLEGGSNDCDIDVKTGCGIQISLDNEVEFNPVDVVEEGLEVGLGPCGMRVAIECGLEFVGVDNKLSVKRADLMGPGLIAWGDCGFQVDVDYVNSYVDDCYYIGCGLVIVGDNIEFDPSQVAGPGIVQYGDCGLTINPGCGIEVALDQVTFKRSDVMGPGLKVWGDCGFQVDCDYCDSGPYYQFDCGLEVVGNVVSVNPVDLAGQGLVQGIGPCDIDVNPGCGIEVVSDEVRFKRSDVMGPGLIAWGDCGIQVDCTYCTSDDYCYNIGCGLTVTGGDTVEVDPTQLAGSGLIVEGTCGLAVDCDWIEANCNIGSDDYCYYIGCGLTVTGGNTVEFDPTQVAGSGLVVEGSCGLAVDCDWIEANCTNNYGYEAGCGLYKAGNVFSINPADLAGDCLEVGAGCAIDVQSILIEVVTDIYCENNEIYKVTELIRVLDC